MKREKIQGFYANIQSGVIKEILSLDLLVAMVIGAMASPISANMIVNICPFRPETVGGELAIFK